MYEFEFSNYVISPIQMPEGRYLMEMTGRRGSGTHHTQIKREGGRGNMEREEKER